MRAYVPRLIVSADCHGCGVCVPVCGPKAVSMHEREGTGAPIARIDPDLCSMCRECLDVCPVEAIVEEYPPPWRDAPGHV